MLSAARSGLTFCQSRSGSKLFAKVISRQQKLPLAGIELKPTLSSSVTCIGEPVINSSSISPGGKKWETRDITTGTSSSFMNKQALGPASNEYATCGNILNTFIHFLKEFSIRYATLAHNYLQSILENTKSLGLAVLYNDYQ